MSQFWALVGVPVLVSLAVNELSDLSPWLARKIIPLAARCWAGPSVSRASPSRASSSRAAELEEEWAALIEDSPGKLWRLLAKTPIRTWPAEGSDQ